MKAKILYVDDEEINLFLFESSLSDNFHIFTANSPNLGLKILEEHQDIQLVISDMRMPIMNGIEFIKKAQNIPPSKCYFILSGFQENQEISQALESGLIQKYLNKPFNRQELIQVISEYIS